VDPSEWKKEVDKVCNLLVIPENVEFIYNSQSDDNLKSFVNIEDINSDYTNRGKTFSILTQYFNKVVNSQEQIKTLSISTNLQKEIGLIDKYEQQLTSVLQNKIGGLTNNTSHTTRIEKDFESQKIKNATLTEKLQSLEENLESKLVL
jgi:hypothetical protein